MHATSLAIFFSVLELYKHILVKFVFVCSETFNIILAGGPKKEAEEDEGQEPEAPEPFEWPDDI